MGTQTASGSGVIISKDGYIVTNEHVVANQQSLQVIFSDGKRADARVVGTDVFHASILLWAATIGLGVLFLAGTGYEWFELITRHKLTISRNLFGTTFYTLVGFHGLHVTAGLTAMLVVLLGLGPSRGDPSRGRRGVELVSWYWHFVDGVWIVVFSVVYLVGR